MADLMTTLVNEEARRLGELLRARRKELNLSLKEVENSTSIRSSYLEAIESGSLSQHLAGIYAVGFLKQYVHFLGLDVEKLSREHTVAFRIHPERHEFAFGIGTLEARSAQQSGSKWLPNILWGSVSLMLMAGAWLIAKWAKLF